MGSFQTFSGVISDFSGVILALSGVILDILWGHFELSFWSFCTIFRVILDFLLSQNFSGVISDYLWGLGSFWTFSRVIF